MSARELLSDGPEGYVARRIVAVKAAKADKDRALAAELQALTKPTAALWAVLAAADDEALVRDLVAATAELARVQGGGGDRAALVAATARRRERVEQVIARAVDDAARWGDVPTARRDEIRSIVERLSRAPEALDAWVDATLRTLPDDAGGFSAFEGLDLAPPPRPERPRPSARTPSRPAAPEPAPEPEPAPAAPVRRGPSPAVVRRATRRVAEAEAALAEAEARLARAQDAVDEARRDLDARRSDLAALDAD